jgi:hypothetical protein
METVINNDELNSKDNKEKKLITGGALAVGGMGYAGYELLKGTDAALTDTPPVRNIVENPPVEESKVTENDDCEADSAVELPSVEEKSFGEAFKEARASFGPGSTFEWKGSTYSTNYRSIEGTSSENTDVTYTSTNEVPRVTSVDHTQGVSSTNVNSEQAHNNYSTTKTNDNDNNANIATSQDEQATSVKSDAVIPDLFESTNSTNNKSAVPDLFGDSNSAAGSPPDLFDSSNGSNAAPDLFGDSKSTTGKYAGADENNDGKLDTIALDKNSDGKVDAIAVDENKDGKFDIYMVDKNSDGILEISIKDTTGNGVDSRDTTESIDYEMTMEDYIELDNDDPMMGNTDDVLEGLF